MFFIMEEVERPSKIIISLFRGKRSIKRLLYTSNTHKLWNRHLMKDRDRNLREVLHDNLIPFGKFHRRLNFSEMFNHFSTVFVFF